MNRKYDLFEKFSDGSSLWLACAYGQEAAMYHLREFAKKSKNHFYAMDVTTGRVLPGAMNALGSELFKSGRGNKSAAA